MIKILVLPVITFMQFAIPSYCQYSFEHISKSEGLSHNNVEAILEDRDGLMWFGTRNGLCRYDGYDIKVYLNNSDSTSISGNRILTLAEDLNGDLWIGTHQNGLNMFSREKNVFVRYGISAGVGSQVTRIKVLKDGSVWIANNNGLAIYDPEKHGFDSFTPYDSAYSINSNLVSDILETADGEVYIATWENDIQRFDRNARRFYGVSYIPDSMTVLNYRKRLFEGPDGNIWISARTHGLCKYDRFNDRATFYNKKDGLNTDVLNGDIIFSPQGELWVATDIGGINIFNPESETFRYITFDKNLRGSLPSDHIYTLYLDNSNRIWVGTFDQGIAYYDPLMNKFHNNRIPPDLYSFFTGKSVISVFQDSDETIWIGTDGQGLHSIDKDYGLISYYYEEGNDRSLSSNVITSIDETASGKILIGTYSGSLCVFDKKRNQFRRYLNDPGDPDGIHSENVWSIIVDSDDNKWLGLLGMGADIFNEEEGTFRNIGPYSGESQIIGFPNVMAIMEDADGDIWFGTEGDGIYIKDKQAGKIMRAPPDSIHDVMVRGVIRDMFQDSGGEIWIATEGNGLYRYNEGTKNIHHFNTNNGLPGMIIQGIQEDRAGNIWVSTYDGLGVLRKGDDFFNSFFSYDGLSSNEFNAEAFIRLEDGSLLLGSINGIDLFDPQNISYNQNLPRILFTKLTILNKEVLPGDTINKRVFLNKDIMFTSELTLTYPEKIFSIEFAAVNYTHPQKCKYKYMLEGFDEEWISTTSDHRFASYSNLKNGDYIFKVQASNNDGKWGNNIEELHIEVLPPFWKTGWFIFLMITLFFGAVLLIYFNRMSILRSRFKREQALKNSRILELEKENIESELEKLTYYTINRNKELISYKNRLKTLSLKAKDSVRQGLNLVMEEIDKEIADDKEWKYIEPRLDKFYNEFITRLREKHPDLTLSEIKVASYVRMNLTSKEISEFMHKTIRAVENDRYRLRKKINLDSNESLQKYLMNL